MNTLKKDITIIVLSDTFFRIIRTDRQRKAD